MITHTLSIVGMPDLGVVRAESIEARECERIEA